MSWQVKVYLMLFQPKIELLQLKNLPKEDLVIFISECGSLQLGMDSEKTPTIIFPNIFVQIYHLVMSYLFM